MIKLGIVTHHFSQLCTRVMALYAKILFPLNILRTTQHIFTKFYICIDIDKILLGIVTGHFSDICNRVMALDLRGNLVSAQYPDNQLVEFHQILYMH